MEKVTPCVGVWIETAVGAWIYGETTVTPCVGVWIETLKLNGSFQKKRGHTLRGCVD